MHTVHEPGRVASGVLALVVHVLFLGLLVIGISWQKKIISPVVVDLWQELPEPPDRKVAPPPEPPRPPKPVPEPRKEPPPPKVATPPKPVPEPRKEPPPPKVETPPKPSPAEIELKEKQRKQKEDEAKRLQEQKKLDEDNRRLAEEEKRQEAEKLRREEEARQVEEQKRMEEERRAEELKREQDRRAEELKREQERKDRAATMERERLQQEAQRKQREAEEAKRRAEAAVRAAQQRTIDTYMQKIQARVVPRIVMPPDLKGSPQGVYEVTLLPGGEVLEIQLKRSSGVAAYDAAVERAINAASPLPVPDDPDLFQQYFRKFNFTFKPQS